VTEFELRKLEILSFQNPGNSRALFQYCEYLCRRFRFTAFGPEDGNGHNVFPMKDNSTGIKRRLIVPVLGAQINLQPISFPQSSPTNHWHQKVRALFDVI
jgi:hypothetical protein